MSSLMSIPLETVLSRLNDVLIAFYFFRLINFSMLTFFAAVWVRLSDSGFAFRNVTKERLFVATLLTGNN